MLEKPKAAGKLSTLMAVAKATESEDTYTEPLNSKAIDYQSST
jgi:hypothetical protein